MDAMYIKYINGRRYSIIKEGENILMSNEKIIPFESRTKVKKDNTVSPRISNVISISTYDNVNEKITNFFFNSIHKNYLKNR